MLGYLTYPETPFQHFGISRHIQINITASRASFVYRGFIISRPRENAIWIMTVLRFSARSILRQFLFTSRCVTDRGRIHIGTVKARQSVNQLIDSCRKAVRAYTESFLDAFF